MSETAAKCPTCGGSGEIENNDPCYAKRNCPDCHGTGEIKAEVGSVELTEQEKTLINAGFSFSPQAKGWLINYDGVLKVLTARLSSLQTTYDRDFKRCNAERLKAQEELNQSRLREKVLMDDYKDYISKHSRCNNGPKV